MSDIGDDATLVTGATGFIGQSLIRALQARGASVIATSRRPGSSAQDERGVEWRQCDLLDVASRPAAFRNIRVAYYLVHSMAGGQAGFRAIERRSAEAFVAAAAKRLLKAVGWLCWILTRGYCTFSTQ
jgi:uncharacterized protein YbjT (DUF2867 family)